MTLRKEDRAVVEEMIDDKINALKPNGWRRLFHTIREWGGVAAVVGVFVALAAAAAYEHHEANTRLAEDAQFHTRTEDRLERIEAVLLDLRAAKSPNAVLEDLGKLGQKQFDQALPALETVAAQPVSEVKPSPEALREVTLKLQQVNPSTPGYWPTVVRFIQFASAGIATDAPPYGSPVNITLRNVTFDGQIIPPRVGVLVLDGGGLKNIKFEHSRIIFTMHPVYMKNVTFTDCAFEFPEIFVPSPYLENASRQLLASDFAHISELPPS